MATLYIVRGPSGSGKTTFVNNVLKPMLIDMMGISADRIGHYEADDWFMRDGHYRFNPRELKDAHADCQRKVWRGLKGGKDAVIVSNTSIKDWELGTYVDMAKRTHSPYKVIRLSTRYKNAHDVPEEVVDRMWANMYDSDGELIVDGSTTPQRLYCAIESDSDGGKNTFMKSVLDEMEDEDK